MKKYLVLGGNGFLGVNIINKLLENKNNKIVVADRKFNNIQKNDRVELKLIDFVNCNDFSQYLSGVDTVYHLISTIVPNEKTENIKNELSDNVFPTLDLLESMLKNGTKKIVFISSGGCVYGEHDINPIKENSPKNPICNYGITKDLVEKYISLYNTYYNIDYRIVRLSNPYDITIKEGKKQGIIPILINQITTNQPIKIWGTGDDIRDYIYIEDAINAIISVENYTGNEKTFNVGTGNGQTINKLIQLIKEELKLDKVCVEYTNGRKCDVKNNILDINKIKEEINWEPKYNLEEGIKKILKNVRDENDDKQSQK